MNEHRSSRRDFLKTSAVAAGGRGHHPGHCPQRPCGGSDVLKIALIGCGGRGTGAAGNCLNVQKIFGQKIELVALADAFEDRAKAALRN